MGRKILHSIVFTVIVGILIYLLPMPCRVDKNLSGIHWAKNDTQFSETVNVTVQGTYLRYLFRTNTFKGTITISDKNSTSSYKVFKLFISKSLGFGALGNWHNGTVDDIGLIRVGGSFDEVIIHLYDKEMGKLSEEYISAPARDRGSAVDLANKMYFKR